MKILIKILIGIGVLLFFILWMTIPYLIEKPVVTVDYFTQYNELIRPANYSEADDAAIALQKLPNPKSASGLTGMPEQPDFLWSYVPADYPKKFSPAEIIQFKEWINQYTQTLEALLEISQKPYYYMPVDPSLYRDEPLYYHFYRYEYDNNLNISHYEIHGLLNWAVVFYLNDNNPSMAIECSKALTAFNRFFKRAGGLYSYYEFSDLLGISDVGTSVALSSEKLRVIQSLLENIDFEYNHDYLAEEICFRDLVQKWFTEGDQGHLSPAAMIQSNVGYLTFEDIPSIIACIYKSLKTERRKPTVDRMEAILEQLRQWKGLRLFQLHQQGIDTEERIRSLAGDNSIIQEHLLPTLHLPFERERFSCQVQATAAIIALFRYRQDQGQFPESLERLMADGYIDRLPRDPYSDGSLVYRKDITDFTLYSLGVDFEDDGGRPSLCRNCGNHLTDWGDGPVYDDPNKKSPRSADARKDAHSDHVFGPTMEIDK